MLWATRPSPCMTGTWTLRAGMRSYVYIYTSPYVYVTYILIRMNIRLPYVYVYEYVHVFVREICVNAFTHATARRLVMLSCAYTCAYADTCICMHTHACWYACKYAYMYTYTCTLTGTSTDASCVRMSIHMDLDLQTNVYAHMRINM